MRENKDVTMMREHLFSFDNVKSKVRFVAGLPTHFNFFTREAFIATNVVVELLSKAVFPLHGTGSTLLAFGTSYCVLHCR